ncbi:MAG: ABC transporter ATP-binding protein [Euryarchaeota archaeon]|nr:ABC transporter ATP-binding protein [Euryarchaeota archaeon]
MYLEAVNLTKRYGKFYALNDLNVKVEGSKCVGYLGPNGAGKTTTLKLFTSLLRPTRGEAIINGHSVQKDKVQALKDVAAVVETPELYPTFTPEEILQMSCALRSVNKCDIKHALEEVGMYEWRNKRVGKFSKGMKQRIALAAALVGNPEILILDEPTSGMDPRGMAEIREVIRNMKKSQRLIFMSSHLLSEVAEVCDEVIMIDRGKFVLHSSMDDVIKRFGGNSVYVTVLEMPDMAKIESIPGVKSVEKVSENRLNIVYEPGEDAQYRILKELIYAGVKVTEYNAAKQMLENAYLKLIGGDRND